METFSALLAICARNSPVPVISPHKCQWRGDLICAWISGWVNNRDAGDLRRNRAHYDVIACHDVVRTFTFCLLPNLHFVLIFLNCGIARPNIQRSGYNRPGEGICTAEPLRRQELQERRACGVSQTSINDNIDTTCVNATVGDKHLHVVFSFSNVIPGHQISMEVVMKNVDDCFSPAWTWSVGSHCYDGTYMQCNASEPYHMAGFTRCLVSCQCWQQPCKMVHVVHNLVPWQDHIAEQLCEIRQQ